MAEQKGPEKKESEGISLELKTSEALTRPQFANYILSNVSKLSGSEQQTTLTFIHVYPIPTGPADSQPEGEVVARVSMGNGTTIALRDLLIRQHPITPTQLKSLRSAARRTTRQK